MHIQGVTRFIYLDFINTFLNIFVLKPVSNLLEQVYLVTSGIKWLAFLSLLSAYNPVKFPEFSFLQIVLE